MSLHCPATLLLIPDVALRQDPATAATPTTPAAAQGAATHLVAAGLRIAVVYGPPDPEAAARGAEVAAALGATHRTLSELATTDPTTARTAVETIADVHRGEHVVALTPAAWFPAVVACLAPTTGGGVGAGPTVLECGDDGWFIRPWPTRHTGTDPANV